MHNRIPVVPEISDVFTSVEPPGSVNDDTQWLRVNTAPSDTGDESAPSVAVSDSGNEIRGRVFSLNPLSTSFDPMISTPPISPEASNSNLFANFQSSFNNQNSVPTPESSPRVQPAPTSAEISPRVMTSSPLHNQIASSSAPATQTNFAFNSILSTPRRTAANSHSITAPQIRSRVGFQTQDFPSPSRSSVGADDVIFRYVLVEFPSNEENFQELLARIRPLSSHKGDVTRLLETQTQIVFVFADLRDSIQAIQIARLTRFAECSATSISRETFQRSGELSESNIENLLSESEAIISIQIENSSRDSQQFLRQIIDLVQTHFDVLSVRRVAEIAIVEFFDERQAETAKLNLNGKRIEGNLINCQFEPLMRPSVTTSASLSQSRRLSLNSISASSPPTSPFSINFNFSPEAQQNAVVPVSQQINSPRRPSAETRSSFSSSSDDQIRTTRLPRNLGPNYGIIRDERTAPEFMIDLDAIARGTELRTTVMIKNIPNRADDDELMNFIDSAVSSPERSYDFFYLRKDFTNDANTAYGFVNFISRPAMLQFLQTRYGQRYNMRNSNKLAAFAWGKYQGLDALINHFRNSPVLEKREDWRPKLFWGPEAGILRGQPREWPAADDSTRRARGRDQSESHGLYPTKQANFQIARVPNHAQRDLTQEGN